MLASKIGAVYEPAHKPLTIVLGDTGFIQLKAYGAVPPTGFDTSAAPLHKPLQVTIVDAIVAPLGPFELLKGILIVDEQALASVTITVYTPAPKPVTTVFVA